MTTMDYFNISSPFTSKTVDINDDIVMDPTDNKLPLMSLPSPVNNSLTSDQSSNESHLTSMVRTTYLSYLHKCLLSNYKMCYEGEEDDASTVKIKKCADQMELHAVRLALESQLYRENMLRLIKDVKSHTISGKAYKTLVIFLKEPKNTFDVAVQTDKAWVDLLKTDNTKSACVSPNEKVSPTASLTLNLSSLFEDTNISGDFNNETDVQQDMSKAPSDTLTTGFNDASQRTEAAPPQLTNDIIVMRNEDEDSQDSLLQHMEDMFGESDDSSDLTRLIEKHQSDNVKINSGINCETNNKCSETDVDGTSNLWSVSETANIPGITKMNAISKNKLSFHSYKERQRKGALSKTNDNSKDKSDEQQQRINAVWFVERVHQVSKFKAKMSELSLRNYRKHRKIKEKFLYLFGDYDDEEMMPDSPICIEEYLPACKDRIAPWIVKYLMPFYKKKRIKNRHLFKAVAKYITDMLILENTFPEEISVSKYIQDYFKNGKCIKIKQDIFL